MIQGRVITVDSLVKRYLSEEALKQIDSLSENTDKNLSKAEKRRYLLELQLLKATVYDNNYEHGKALPLLLDILEKSLTHHLDNITARTYLLLASVKGKGNDLEENEQYLNLAKSYIQKYNFEDLYGAYYYQKGIFHRLKSEFDSVLYNAEKGLEYGLKYKNEEDIALANTMLGIGYGGNPSGGKKEMQQAIDHYKQSIPYYKKIGNYTHLAVMYRNISREYFKHYEIEKSFLYSDSAYLYYDKISYFFKEQLPLQRFDLHYYVGNKDSALHYLMEFHNVSFANLTLRESNKIKDITEKYQNDKKEVVIKNKNQQMVWVSSLLTVIAVASVLLIRKNRQVNRQNKTISTQLVELSGTLEQKQVLLSELQHRVKNNLQHVISILEIQKESVDFNNIDELIRGNQNRIHSMALLHKKLNVSDNVKEVDLKKYISELSELVKDSYDSYGRKVNLQIRCDIEKVSLEKALPLGLIIVELVSNSMKHAFKNRRMGLISIEITKDHALQKNKLYYADNGQGFDFSLISEKGLGLEIIKGLIDQLGANVETRNSNGFELTVYFK